MSPRLLPSLCLATAALCFGSTSAVAADVTQLAPVSVTATRSHDALAGGPFSGVALDGDAVRSSANLTLDGALRGLAGFSLFRRTDSFAAHPTAQGVSLRGIGPSGASRSLVLLDGVPLNDPFGGWIVWNKVPRESLARIEIVPGAGGTAWGNAALGGVVQLFTEPPLAARQRLATRIGSFDTHDVEAQFAAPAGSGTLQILGRDFSTDGYVTVAPDRRGPIDTPAGSRARWGTLRWRQPLGREGSATLTVRRFSEDRNNGTPYQRNATDETFGSLQIETRASATLRWQAVVYGQSQEFASTFSSVNANRTAETPASHQFAVPATALGLSWVGEWTPTASASTTFGADLRDVRGETREDSAFSGNAFTRRRFAGGRQTIVGVFALHQQTLPGDARLAAGLRLDGWRESDGHRRDYLAGTPAGDERYPQIDDIELSPSLGLSWPASQAVRLHANVQQSFRRPTLNELYRPFRVGNVITDANPALKTERVTSAELGAQARLGAWQFAAAVFHNELRDAVGNVTIARGPGTFPGIGFVPAGGEGRRRLNLDRVRVQGISLESTWTVSPHLSISAQYLYDRARVRRATVSPSLAGLRLAQVPEHAASLAINWRAGRWSFSPRVRYLGAQFEDDQNTLRLAPAAVVDAGLSFQLNAAAELFATVENAFSERIETGRSADGLVNLGTPRLWLVGVRLSR